MHNASDLPPLRLDHLTAEPLLRLLLAQRGLEPPDLRPDEAWDVFRAFAQIPCPGYHDVTSFQATRETESDSESPRIPFLYCTLTREFAGELPVENRAVQIQWAVEADAQVGEIELWSDEFDSLGAFYDAVEKSPQFAALMRLNGTADVFAVHLEDWENEGNGA